MLSDSISPFPAQYHTQSIYTYVQETTHSIHQGTKILISGVLHEQSDPPAQLLIFMPNCTYLPKDSVSSTTFLQKEEFSHRCRILTSLMLQNQISEIPKTERKSSTTHLIIPSVKLKSLFVYPQRIQYTS